MQFNKSCVQMQTTSLHPNTIRARLKKAGLTPARSYTGERRMGLKGRIAKPTYWLAGFRVASDAAAIYVFFQHELVYETNEAKTNAQNYHEALRRDYECFINRKYQVVVIRG